jgi:hypothetical protein
MASGVGRDFAWVCNQNSKTVRCFENIDRKQLNKSMSNPRNRFHVDWTRLDIRAKPLWSHACNESRAWAVCRNAVLVAGKSELVALDIDDGSKLWSHPLPAAPAVWGLAVDSKGRVIVTLEDGRVLCFGQDSLV